MKLAVAHNHPLLHNEPASMQNLAIKAISEGHEAARSYRTILLEGQLNDANRAFRLSECPCAALRFAARETMTNSMPGHLAHHSLETQIRS